LLVETYPDDSANSLALKYGMIAGFGASQNYKAFRDTISSFKIDGTFESEVKRIARKKAKIKDTYLREAKEWLKNYDS
jgi:hypothetical protein